MILYILFFSFLFSFHGTTGHLSIHGRREKLTSTDNENRSGGLGIRKDTAIGSANDSCPESLQEIHAHGTLLMREMKAEEGGEKEEKKCRVWSNYRRPPPPPPPWQRSNRYPTSPSENSVRVSGQSDRLDMAFPPNR